MVLLAVPANFVVSNGAFLLDCRRSSSLRFTLAAARRTLTIDKCLKSVSLPVGHEVRLLEFHGGGGTALRFDYLEAGGGPAGFFHFASIGCKTTGSGASAGKQLQ